MTRDEARKLLGGYATGSLTESEKAALMAAALDDQELFEELAGEQEVKEILEEPGARERLLGALDPEPAPAWWSRPWPWTAGAVTVAIAIMIVVVQRTPLPPTQEVAQVVKPAEPVTIPAPLPPPAAPVKRKAAQVANAPAPPAPQPSVDAIAEARADKAESPPLAAPQAVGGVSAFAARQAETAAVNAVRLFALAYTIRAEGVLEIVPSSPGFLSVTAGTTVLYSSAGVAAGTTIRVPVPAGAASLLIGFYAVQGATTAPVRLDQSSGTVMDQDPPNGKILIQLSLTPRTQ